MSSSEEGSASTLPLPTRLGPVELAVLETVLEQEASTGQPCPIVRFRLALPSKGHRDALGNLLAADLIEATSVGYRLQLRGVLILADRPAAQRWIAVCNMAISVLAECFREREGGSATIEDVAHHGRIPEISQTDVERAITHLNDISLLGGSSRSQETGYVSKFTTLEAIIDAVNIESMLVRRSIFRDAFVEHSAAEKGALPGGDDSAAIAAAERSLSTDNVPWGSFTQWLTRQPWIPAFVAVIIVNGLLAVRRDPRQSAYAASRPLESVRTDTIAGATTVAETPNVAGALNVAAATQLARRRVLAAVALATSVLCSVGAATVVGIYDGAGAIVGSALLCAVFAFVAGLGLVTTKDDAESLGFRVSAGAVRWAAGSPAHLAVFAAGALSVAALAILAGPVSLLDYVVRADQQNFAVRWSRVMPLPSQWMKSSYGAAELRVWSPSRTRFENDAHCVSSAGTATVATFTSGPAGLRVITCTSTPLRDQDVVDSLLRQTASDSLCLNGVEYAPVLLDGVSRYVGRAPFRRSDGSRREFPACRATAHGTPPPAAGAHGSELESHCSSRGGRLLTEREWRSLSARALRDVNRVARLRPRAVRLGIGSVGGVLFEPGLPEFVNECPGAPSCWERKALIVTSEFKTIAGKNPAQGTFRCVLGNGIDKTGRIHRWLVAGPLPFDETTGFSVRQLAGLATTTPVAGDALPADLVGDSCEGSRCAWRPNESALIDGQSVSTCKPGQQRICGPAGRQDQLSVDLGCAFGAIDPPASVAYLATNLRVEADTEVLFATAADDDYKFFLDGRELAAWTGSSHCLEERPCGLAARADTTPCADITPAKLTRGSHRLFVAVANRLGWWGVSVRVLNNDLSTFPQGIETTLASVPE